ncbi:putative PGG domain-containing protein [Helianthus debilis subsp. tardiflorus]
MRVPIATLYPIYQLTYLLILMCRLPFSMLYFLLWKALAVIVPPIKNIEKKKRKYQEAKKVLSLICDQMGTSNNGYRESILEAVRQDTYEVVDEILFRSPDTINCKDEEGHNIIQLAIISRSEKVYNLIYHIIERTESYRKITDSCMNTLAHFTGRLAPSLALSRTVGATLQLQRELFWHEEVVKLMLPLELTKQNIDEETPAMVFTREHGDLMKEGENWLKTTSESCSITAALIVTVVFAAAITVPGGSNQESGIPVFKKEFAFTIFALSNAFALFTATTALLEFLTILTARFYERDFMYNLPKAVVIGLLMLILSTSSMMVAFAATLFLVFCEQRLWMLPPICAFACIPIWFVVLGKLSLFIDLIQSTYIPIFGKKSYLESCKINQKNTIFTY